MTSQINYSSIDATYPVAGQDNSSQGFRDNFTLIKNNFQAAYNEISALQSNTVVFNAVNDLQGTTTLANGIFNGSRITLYDFGTNSGSLAVTYTNGSYQKITLNGSLIITGFNNWPSSGTQTSMRIEITVPSVAYTVTWPSSVTLNCDTLANVNNKTITFTDTGTYIFELTSTDGGTNISVQDLSRNRNVVQGNLQINTIVSGSTVTGISMTVSNIGGVAVGNITATNFIGNIISLTSNSGSFTGNVTANNIIANTGIYGNILTATQSNITLLGTLTSLSVSGNANVGNLVTTGMTDMCGGSQYGIQYLSLANGGSGTIYSNVGVVIVEFTSNVAGPVSLTMPTTPVNGQAIKIAFGNNTCANLSHVAGGGQTLLGSRTAGNAEAGGEWIYYTTKNTWYKST